MEIFLTLQKCIEMCLRFVLFISWEKFENNLENFFLKIQKIWGTFLYYFFLKILKIRENFSGNSVNRENFWEIGGSPIFSKNSKNPKNFFRKFRDFYLKNFYEISENSENFFGKFGKFAKIFLIFWKIIELSLLQKKLN